ncbi:MAG: DeoR family transcriptional regulator [Bdellovibrio sp.]|nr:DeoR family transcriptional regulator [Bdellovibrio sp.]
MNLLNEDQFRILERLKTHGTLSIDAITDWYNKPKTAVRRSLLDLEKKGLIERVLIKSARGRPLVAFRLGSEAKVVFPTKEAEVLNELIKFLVQQGQRPLLESFFQEYWEKRYERVMEKISRRKCKDLSARLEALKEVLNEDGFYARSNLSKKDKQLTMRECHCPISAVASATNVPCDLESQLISKVLNLDCISAEPMSGKQGECRFKFKIP